jgi:branched-chain amino acid transport system ATP-binding protein
LQHELGLAVILIEHNMRIVMNTCRRIQVLNYGQLIAEGEPHAIRNDARVVEAYLGHTVVEQ